jgi:hypothetical protein
MIETQDPAGPMANASSGARRAIDDPREPWQEGCGAVLQVVAPERASSCGPASTDDRRVGVVPGRRQAPATGAIDDESAFGGLRRS